MRIFNTRHNNTKRHPYSRKQFCNKIKNVLKFDVEIHNMWARQEGISPLTSSTIIDKTRNEVLRGPHLKKGKKY